MKKVVWLIVVGYVMTSWLFWPSPALSHETLTTTVLFDREIVRILNKHCVMCHVENGLSFPLTTYEETWLRGRSIRSTVLRRHMPPWAAVPGYGQFSNDNSLTLRETQFIVSWVEGLGPRNAGRVFLNVLDPRAVPRQEVRAQPHVGHWRIGEPNLTRPLAPNTIDAQQGDIVQRTVVDLGLTTARRVRGLEYLPGDRRVVRAAFFSVQETGQWIGSWTPWHPFVNLPAGVAYRLAAGSHVVAEIHYRGTNEQVVDRGTLGLFFAEGSTTRAPSDLVIDAKRDVSVGAATQKLRGATRLAAETHALALWPEIRPGVKSIEVSARKPDGGTEVLLFAKDGQVEWPTPYILKEPLLLRRGTELSVTTYHDKTVTTPQPTAMRLTISRY